MAPPTMCMVIVVILGMTATLPGPTMGRADGSSVPARANVNGTQEDKRCLPLERRQDLLDNRLMKREADINTRLNGLGTRLDNLHNQLNTQQTEVNTRLNRMDNRLNGIETAITDMKAYLQQRMEAMDRKTEWAMTDTKPRHGCTARDKSKVYSSCGEALAQGGTCSGVYTIALDCDNPIEVYCEQSLDSGGWMVFQVRYNGSVDFYQDWQGYKTGFGDLRGEFWLGNDNIHQLTKHRDHKLKIELVSPDGEVEYADYSTFHVADESAKYRLTVTGYSGGTSPGDSMAYQNGQLFSTLDEDNDRAAGSCAQEKHAGWWYNACQNCNLNGPYGSTVQYRGFNWYKWKEHDEVSLKSTRMMVKKRQ